MASNPQGKAPRLNALDRVVAAIWPQRGLSRLRARLVLAHYEAAKPNPQRKFRASSGEPNALPAMAAVPLRNQVRYLERNHDITRGALNVLVNNTVGPQGIGVEFQPRKPDGTIHEAYAAALTEAWRDFCRRPEVTWRLPMPAMQRLQARTLYRDGEVFGQHVMGPMASLDHGTRVPYSVELIEPDLLPHDFDDESRGIRQAIERNGWGRPTAFHVYKGHPEDASTARGAQFRNLKRVPADRMFHAALVDRIGQLRGVSAFASVITRIEDIKDYEESERIAAKVAAMITGFVKRSSPDGYDAAGMALDEQGNLKPREMSMRPGMIIDSLAVGEELGLLDPNRPNPNLLAFRNGQLRAFAAGIGASYSSLARDYNGTYSAQRQELVEQWVNYMVLCDLFVGSQVRPVVEKFIEVADLSGVVPMPPDVRLGSHDDVLYVAPSMPWIDPAREVTAWLAAVQAGFASEYEVLRRQGKNPRDVLEQIATWRKTARDRGVFLNSDIAAAADAQAEANARAAQASAGVRTASAAAGTTRAT